MAVETPKPIDVCEELPSAPPERENEACFEGKKQRRRKSLIRYIDFFPQTTKFERLLFKGLVGRQKGNVWSRSRTEDYECKQVNFLKLITTVHGSFLFTKLSNNYLGGVFCCFFEIARRLLSFIFFLL